VTATAYRSAVTPGRDGFGALLHAEWTKFRTVRGWLVATAAAALLMLAFGLLVANGSHSTVATTAHPEGVTGHPYVPLGPGGEPVTDTFYFLHRTLDGDGSITTRVSSLTGGIAHPETGGTSGGLPAWAKAGLIIKANTRQGSAYAAIMVTAGHGVRMQDDYTGDTAGPTGSVSASSPRWLRLTRTGDTITGYASTDGQQWTRVGAARLPGLPTSVPAGMFTTSPIWSSVDRQGLGTATARAGATRATAVFDEPALRGGWAAGSWTGSRIGADLASAQAGYRHTAGRYAVTGSGDIAPSVEDTGPGHVLVGAFAALAVLCVVGVLFVSTEYRRGLMRTTLTASPRRGRVLVAKAVVLGAVTFVVGLVAVAVTLPVSEHVLAANGNFVLPLDAAATAQVVAGTAALLAVAAVLALAVGAVLRSGAAAAATVIVLVVLPYLLGTTGVLPTAAARWLLRVTPAAAFAVQQVVPAYAQVDHAYTPPSGFFPLPPWAGFAVLCGWAAVALAAALVLLRQREA
jgi:ABC-type transport system involved in multi-copper enzyme maturation permease subunit